MAGVALAVVAAVTGVISYIHIFSLTVALHQPVVVARLYPFGVDGLVIIGGVVLLQASLEYPWLGWLGVVPGVGASLFANWESGIRYGYLSAAWATIPAASFALATYLLERWLKGQANRPGAARFVPDSNQSAAIASLRATLAAGNPWSGRQLEERFGLTRATATKVRQLVLAEANGHGSEGSKDQTDQ